MTGMTTDQRNTLVESRAARRIKAILQAGGRHLHVILDSQAAQDLAAITGKSGASATATVARLLREERLRNG